MKPAKWLLAGRRGWTNSYYPEWSIRDIPGGCCVYFRGRYYVNTRRSFSGAVRLIQGVSA